MESRNGLARSALPFPDWLVRFGRRLLQLPDGRYEITFTVDGERRDWTITYKGKIERGQR
ncbi:MAG: hypothetical protein GXY76_16775 [Chloroflexi bacterium]|nr:hypothetical protein [Chloroflexota bacterium]